MSVWGHLGGMELFGLFGRYLLLSMLSIGGAITTAPEMHRYLVGEQHWITDSQFTSSVALAQAAPGPNILFVAVLGWNVAGLTGVVVTMMGIMLPSTTLALYATRWGRARQETRGVRAFTSGMAPITVGLVVATGWLLAEPARGHWQAIALVIATVVVMVTTRISPLWMMLVGAALGVFGWV
jgi:chromate transporter